MKVKNGEIFISREPLQKLLEMKLPVKASYQVAKLANRFNEQLKVIDDVRNGLIRKYGKPDPEKGGQLRIDPANENWEKFIAEFNELMELEIEMVIEKIGIPEKVTGTCDKCNHNMDIILQIEPSILMALEKFVVIQ